MCRRWCSVYKGYVKKGDQYWSYFERGWRSADKYIGVSVSDIDKVRRLKRVQRHRH